MRLVRLIELLQGGKGYSVDALSVECEVSRRTVFRDLDVLREAGVPLVFDEDLRVYQIPGWRMLPPTSFTPDEALALIVLGHELGNGRGLPLMSAARRAVMKLESSLPQRVRDYLRQVAPGVRIAVGPSNALEGTDRVYEQLVRALGERRSVRVHYESLTEWQVIITRLSPYQLLFSRRSWYVIGRSSLHREVRTFNLGRIRRLEPLDDRYQIPHKFSLDGYLRNAWHLIPEKGPDEKVVIRFSPQVAQNVAEVAWHKTQQVVRRPDGGIDFHVTVSGLGEITWWILGYGDQAEVIEPPALRQRVAEHARRLVERYRDVPGPV